MEELIDEREEVMVSATGSVPTRRKAYFLKPTISAMEASPSFKLPFLSPKCSWPMSVRFNGWRNPQKKWEAWVDQMQAKHGDSWEKAGIFEAIQVSKYRFKRNDELIYGVSERWCSDSNTFVFPWGEATLTLEDMLILGGFSVLGSSAFAPISSADMEEAERGLRAVPKSRRNHRKWLDIYMDSGSAIEHEAFLCLWISRFVIPGNEVDRIGDHVFSVAVSLSRGVRVSLAPSVLANIYRDLGILKETMALASSLEENKQNRSILAVSLWAPLQYLQLWIWERFLVFRPEPNFLKSGEVRATRWRGLGRDEIGNVRPIIDSCADVFIWRPYCLNIDEWSFPEFYKEHVLMPEKVESYIRCLRGSFLVGSDGIEPYQPHRVAMQFGLDQDLPGLIPRSSEGAEAAWENFAKALSSDFSVYLPGRLFEGDLSIQYKKWWNESVVVPVQSFSGLLKGLRTRNIHNLRLCSNVVGIKTEAYDVDDVPPGFPRKAKDDPPIPDSMFVKQIKKEPISPNYPAAIYPKNKMSRTVKNQSLKECLKLKVKRI